MTTFLMFLQTLYVEQGKSIKDTCPPSCSSILHSLNRTFACFWGCCCW